MSDDTPSVSIGFLLAAAGMKVKMKTGFPLSFLQERDTIMRKNRFFEKMFDQNSQKSKK